MTPRFIWILYFIIVFYNWVDYWNTSLLLSVGGTELNPLLNYFIRVTGSVHSIFFVKLVPIIALGVYIAVKLKYIRR